ncbi:MAG: 6-carboxytetrahydropterin synthase QueD [Spirochaetaceae bacterium]|jgi:6-pyruvoyltetrahydropterin/6-carboxytetrahydropterin synthase|nr:6-carboxytetrahydropterin synthase QueD [Spirochaetaceae bacterium]
MFTVRVESEFAAAHFLSHYHGKCENLHGHNYRVRLWARGAELSEGGMLADFGILKQALRAVIAELDHTNLNDKAIFEGDPSAERIARYIYNGVEAELSRTKDGAQAAALLYAVDVYETPVNMARYTRDGA